MPSPGRQVSEMVGHADGAADEEGAGARHPADLPEGYHAPAGGQVWHDQLRESDRLPAGRGVIGLRQVDEMALRPGRGSRSESGRPRAWGCGARG